MGDVAISEVIFTALSLLFLLLGVVLLVSIFMSTINPYEQVTFANVEKLRATMDQVCSTNGDATIKFDMPQNTPKLTSLIPVMPIWMIRTTGDPNYVLYYEAFPAGDATGWEVYQGMQDRIVAPFQNGAGKSSADVTNFVKTISQGWSQFQAPLEGIIINNIILGPTRSDYYLGKEASSGPSVNADKDTKQYGEWKNKINEETGEPASGDNKFVFQNYFSLTPFEKSAVKYEPCGTNALCLKTRSGVYTFPLDQCKDIKYVELQYDARNRKTIYGGIGATIAIVAGGWLVLGPTGAVVGTVAADGTISTTTLAAATTATSAGGAATATATSWIPGSIMIAEPAAAGATSTTATLAFVGEETATTATLYSTEAATSASGSGIASWISFLGSKSWNIAKGFASLVWKGIGILPGAQTITIGTGGALGAAGASFSAYKVGEFFAGAFLSYKVEDFNIESPCSISSMTIKKVDCDSLQCTNVISYPIYKYGGGGKLAVAGNHYTCVEKIGKDIQVPAGDGFNHGKCLQVNVEEKADGFCWTPDPYKDSWISDTQFIASKLGFFPIQQSTGYLTSFKAVVLKYYALGKMEDWLKWSERRLSWGWPG